MEKADEYKRRAEEVARMAQDPKLTAAERNGYERIAQEWRVLEAAARDRARG